MRRMMAYIIASLVMGGLWAVASSHQVVFAQQGTEKKAEEKTAIEQKAQNPAFMNAWKQISSTVNKKRTSKTSQGTATAGVRGKEAEDAIVDQMYFRGGTAYPGKSKIENAILVLQQTIEETDASDPASTAEPRFYVGQCYAELGQIDKAVASYDNVIKVAPKSDWADKARAEKKRLTEK